MKNKGWGIRFKSLVKKKKTIQNFLCRTNITIYGCKKQKLQKKTKSLRDQFWYPRKIIIVVL